MEEIKSFRRHINWRQCVDLIWVFIKKKKNSKKKKKEMSQLQWEILTEVSDIKKLFVSILLFH